MSSLRPVTPSRLPARYKTYALAREKSKEECTIKLDEEYLLFILNVLRSHELRRISNLKTRVKKGFEVSSYDLRYLPCDLSHLVIENKEMYEKLKTKVEAQKKAHIEKPMPPFEKTTVKISLLNIDDQDLTGFEDELSEENE